MTYSVFALYLYIQNIFINNYKKITLTIVVGKFNGGSSCKAL